MSISHVLPVWEDPQAGGCGGGGSGGVHQRAASKKEGEERQLAADRFQRSLS